MADDFAWDVFIAYSRADSSVAHSLAKQLREDRLRVWLDAWEIQDGDDHAAKVEDGLERSRVLVLCMSEAAFGSDWSRLESTTFRFRDPQNRERRFIALRLDEAPIRNSLAAFAYIGWLSVDRDQGYSRVLEACRPPMPPLRAPRQRPLIHRAEKAAFINHHGAGVIEYSFTADGGKVLIVSTDGTVWSWSSQSGELKRIRVRKEPIKGKMGRRSTAGNWSEGWGAEDHTDGVWSATWSPDGCLALFSLHDMTAKLWDPESEQDLHILQGHTAAIWTVALSADGRLAVSGSDDGHVRLWDVATGSCLRVLGGHTEPVFSVACSADGRRALSGSRDKTLRLWDVESGRCLRIFEGHTDLLRSVTLSADGRYALSGSSDRTARLWEVDTGRCLHVLEGHIAPVYSVAWSERDRLALTGSGDTTVRLWHADSGRCLCVLEGHTHPIVRVAWSFDGRSAISGDSAGGVRTWDLSKFVAETRAPAPVPAITPALKQVQYTNAKVLLVGESGAGKTGLSKLAI
jgi:WD40 repeat protein